MTVGSEDPKRLTSNPKRLTPVESRHRFPTLSARHVKPTHSNFSACILQTSYPLSPLATSHHATSHLARLHSQKMGSPGTSACVWSPHLPLPCDRHAPPTQRTLCCRVLRFHLTQRHGRGCRQLNEQQQPRVTAATQQVGTQQSHMTHKHASVTSCGRATHPVPTCR